MTKINNKALSLIILILICCAVMAAFEVIVKPMYLVKSAFKLMLFMLVPLLWGLCTKHRGFIKLITPSRKGICMSLCAGVGLYIVIISAYFLLGGFFELDGIADSLRNSVGVTRDNFLYVSLYISFINSILEEFFFRGFAYLTLAETLGGNDLKKRAHSQRLAGIFSASVFALYHIPMVTGWFSPLLFSLIVLALFCGGLIFNFFNSKFINIYMSWMIHMFINFAINTIGFILLTD